MDFFSALEILTSGMRAERIRMNVSSSNLANAKTTRTPEGGPYRRQKAVFDSVNARGGIMSLLSLKMRSSVLRLRRLSKTQDLHAVFMTPDILTRTIKVMLVCLM